MGYMYSWPWRNYSTVQKKWRGNLSKSVNFGEFWRPNGETSFQTKKQAKFRKQGDKSKQNFVAWRNFVPGWMKFRVIKTKFCFFEAKFRFSETKYCFVERKFRTRLGRELFNWADMSSSIRVRIVYESWSPFLVSSIKSSVQKTSSLIHRL